jgi:hypothetical protein
VDGWYTCDHTHFVCVARHRSPRSHDGEVLGQRRGRIGGGLRNDR